MIDTQLKLLFAVPFLIIIFSFLVVDFIPLQSALTAEEQQIIGFAPEDFSIPNIARTRPTIERSQPFQMSTRSQQSLDVATKETTLPRCQVTSIVIGPQGKTAVVGGMLVREGERIGSLLVKKIEPTRILVQPSLANEGQSPDSLQQWLYLEKMP